MSKAIKNKIVALFCILTLFVTTTIPAAYASELEESLSDGVVTNVKKGDEVPFDGVLLSNGAAAKLFGEIKFFEEECKLTLSRELDILTIKHTAELNALQLRLDVETTRTESLIKIKNERIEFLEENWNPPAWYESGEFWLAVGVISGVLITVSAGHAIHSASQ